MNLIDIVELVIIVVVFAVGVGGFIYAATNKDEEK